MVFGRILSCLVLFSIAFTAAARTGAPVLIGEGHRLHSRVLEEDRDYRVHLPASYFWAKDRRYPVLYVLDGQTHFEHSAASTAFLAAQGEIPEVIVVALTSTVRVRDFTQTDWASHWVGGGGAKNFLRFLSTEWIPEIERNFRVSDYRILSGHSSSGQFVLYALSEQPDLFKAYIAMSPSLDWDDNLPQRSLDASFDKKRDTKAFVYVARSDDGGRALADYDRLVQTLSEKAPSGIRWHNQPFPDEFHVSVALLAQIDALRHLYEGYRLPHDLEDKGLDAVQRHFDAVSRKVGTPIAIPEGVINNFAYKALAEGQTDEAITLFKRNADANPNSANAFDGLTDGYAQAKRWNEASVSAERALALAKQHADPNLAYFTSQSAKMKTALDAEAIAPK